MTAPRQPNPSDLLTLTKVLADFDVEYVVIGGAAMALHGFERMTKDIDLLLPVDPANNARLRNFMHPSAASNPCCRARCAAPQWF